MGSQRRRSACTEEAMAGEFSFDVVSDYAAAAGRPATSVREMMEDVNG